MDGSVIFASSILLSLLGSKVDANSQLYKIKSSSNQFYSNSLLSEIPTDSINTCSMRCFMRGKTCGCHSFNSLQNVCRLYEYCCQSKTTVNDTGWDYYVADHDLTCPAEYIKMINIAVGVCLKYFATPTQYQSATTNCQQIGGQLIRLDTRDKFDIFQHFLNCNKNANEKFGVWVQAIRRKNHVWKFEDGSKISEACPREESGGENDIRLRFSTVTGTCMDTPGSTKYRYVCEYL